MSNEEARSIHEELRTNKSLQSLDLSYNGISINCILLICDALRTNASLKYLELTYNNEYYDYGKFIDFIRNKYFMKDIDLHGSKIRDEGAIAIEYFSPKFKFILS